MHFDLTQTHRAQHLTVQIPSDIVRFFCLSSSKQQTKVVTSGEKKVEQLVMQEHFSLRNVRDKIAQKKRK